MSLSEPSLKPTRPYFSSGPCAKISSWSLDLLKNAAISRSHRSAVGLDKLKQVVRLTRSLLEIPEDYFVGIISGSATGALETAFWNLLGPNPLFILVQDVFSKRWALDIEQQLKITPCVVREAPHGLLPDLVDIPETHDLILNWNGSTAGVCFKDGEWFKSTPNRLVIADVASAVFTTDLPWHKFDAAAFSWQKGLGSEAAHGMLVLSSKAVKRLESYQPTWPIPYLFKLRSGQNFYQDLFEEKTLNTPSLLAVEDYLQSLLWAQKIGGLPELVARTHRNFEVIDQWVQTRDWVAFLGRDPTTRSQSTVCLEIIAPHFKNLSLKDQWAFLGKMVHLLEERAVAYDFKNHGEAVPSLRLWAGPTIETEDLRQVMPWLEWAYGQVFEMFFKDSKRHSAASR